jgi:hypothetical protein
MVNLLSNSAHIQLLHEKIASSRSDDELLLWLILMTSCKIYLKDAQVIDSPSPNVLAPLTWRGAAEVIAYSLRDESDQDRTMPEYWYRLYCDHYETMKSMNLSVVLHEYIVSLDNDDRINKACIDESIGL